MCIDDWTAIASLVIITRPPSFDLIDPRLLNRDTGSLTCPKPTVLGVLSMNLAEVSVGLGRHVSHIPPEELALSFKYRYVAGYLYHVGITLPKYSAILFYIRVFKGSWRTSRLFRANIMLAASLVTAWLLLAVPSTIFQCIPVRKSWLPQTPGHCENANQWLIGFTIVSIIIDVHIMLLPVPVLWSLHTGRPRKLILIGFFFCAYW